ncbi:hypothetical protein HNW13_018460 [Shewanella sp. BF02_Schw]|uniref:hypothetical protein n=1 Tax=Shewanella sp. BF02_Schw TaxID=394908 RepID=UPI001783215D|nr:hypothetical protein [Shewanella sp. BF02_Schw]MBO1897724.1 hypothetical protein [Shewanella sp. BF02_Schw]
MRVITNTSSVQKGLADGRLRIINEQSTYSNSLLKSQNRQAKDSLVVEYNGEILFPNEELLKELMGIPESFTLDANNKEIPTEIVGQSVDYPFYKMLMEQVKIHITEFIESTKSPHLIDSSF